MEEIINKVNTRNDRTGSIIIPYFLKHKYIYSSTDIGIDNFSNVVLNYSHGIKSR